jgi:hypothetical protein
MGTELKPLLAGQLDFVLFDGSSSMQPQWWDCLAALEAMRQRLVSAQVASHMLVSVFDTTDHAFVQRDVAVADCPSFTQEPLRAYFDSTPLFDAINAMGRHLARLSPRQASILIVTDGEENASDTTLEEARQVLDWCRAQGWQVTFMGVDFNNSRQARALGADESNSIGVQRRLLTAAAELFAEKRVAYGHSGKSIRFSGEEKTEFGGYLVAPGGKAPKSEPVA